MNEIDTCIIDTPKADLDKFKQAYSALKPGAWLLALTNPIDFEIGMCIEQAGFEVKDSIYVLQPNKTSIVLMAMKPLEGTYVENALKWNVSGLNIDAGRIPHITINGGNLADNPHLRDKIAGGNGGKIITTETDRRFNVQSPGGRWPANLILMHHDECKQTGYTKIKNPCGSVSGNEPSYTGGDNTHCYGVYNRVCFQKYGDDDGYETINKWECHHTCPVLEMDIQSGVRPYGSNKACVEGTASRYYYQCKSMDELLIYLCNLTKPPFDETSVLSFGESDSVSKACLVTNRIYVGI